MEEPMPWEACSCPLTSMDVWDKLQWEFFVLKSTVVRVAASDDGELLVSDSPASSKVQMSCMGCWIGVWAGGCQRPRRSWMCTHALAAVSWHWLPVLHWGLGVPLVQAIPHTAGAPWSGGVSWCEECRQPLPQHGSELHRLLSALPSQLGWY